MGRRAVGLYSSAVIPDSADNCRFYVQEIDETDFSQRLQSPHMRQKFGHNIPVFDDLQRLGLIPNMTIPLLHDRNRLYVADGSGGWNEVRVR